MALKIVTDSAADLPQDFIASHGIEVVPLMVYHGEREYEDGVSLLPAELFAGMREGQTYKTSQPLYGRFEACFRRLAENGDEGIYIAFSSELSGTHQTSLLVRQSVLDDHPGLALDIVDSRCASLGLGLVVRHAAELAAGGASRAEVLQAVEAQARRMEHIFTVDNLEYLVRGGRVSPVAAFIGGLLNIKPILHVDGGKLVPLEKVRGRKKVFARILDLMEERGTNVKDQLIGISHGDDLEAAEEMRSMIAERFGCERFFIGMIGSSIGAHAGPGTIAVFFANDRR
ncbi:DegV family protein [Paenibacillus antri]|uniref:DegV family protein n=1 Tax=Paenibacillus antri TaxID=2582848 RepID=A0A5R9FZD7_9BACL|nr:DegV family protein [Paenibacillus antri]TLS49422.1 DegV family protein [Paenibacillus antri]